MKEREEERGNDQSGKPSKENQLQWDALSEAEKAQWIAEIRKATVKTKDTTPSQSQKKSYGNKGEFSQTNGVPTISNKPATTTDIVQTRVHWLLSWIHKFRKTLVILILFVFLPEKGNNLVSFFTHFTGKSLELIKQFIQWI